jgi:hypothetical protein
MTEAQMPPSCLSCLDHGYRVRTGDEASGATLNAEAARLSGIRGKRIPCHCGRKPVDEREPGKASRKAPKA